MVTILEDLRLDDWHQAVLLTDGAVPRQLLGVLLDGCLGWQAFADFENGSPLRESAAKLVVLGAPC